jgi:hypothetical protein
MAVSSDALSPALGGADGFGPLQKLVLDAVSNLPILVAFFHVGFCRNLCAIPISAPSSPAHLQVRGAPAGTRRRG